MIKRILKRLFKPLWMEIFGKYIYMLKNEQIRTQKKLAMKDDIWRINDTLFYVPQYPIDYIQSCIVDYNKFFEQEILEALDIYINGDSIIIDIGANIGNHSIYWGKNCYAKKIYCFEPVEETFSVLMKNIKLNQLENTIYPMNIALSNEKSMASIERFTYSDIGGTSIKKNVLGHIQVDALDNVVMYEDRIDFIKIDVEGHEVEVLNGAVNTISKHSPAIFIESFSENYKTVDGILTGWGYVLIDSFKDDNYLYIKNKL